MKPRLLTTAFLIGIIGTFHLGSSHVNAQEEINEHKVTFVCGTWREVPVTVARKNNKLIPIIRWSGDYFENHSPMDRCEIVSDQFQKAYEQGILQYVTTGRKNRQNIVCVALGENEKCALQLFTLKPESDPSTTLSKLMNIRHNSSGPLNQSDKRIYVNMNDFLDSTNPILESDFTKINNKDEDIVDQPSRNESDSSGRLW